MPHASVCAVTFLVLCGGASPPAAAEQSQRAAVADLAARAPNVTARPQGEGAVSAASTVSTASTAPAGLETSTTAGQADPSTTALRSAPRPGLGPLALALVPGVLLHGTGLYASDDGDGASHLLALEGVGLAAIVAGFAPIVLTGASRRIIGPAYALTLTGVGAFVVSWLADLYGAGVGATAGRPAAAVPIELGAGLVYAYDPSLEPTTYALVQAEWQSGAWRLAPSALVNVDASRSRLRLLGARRLHSDADGTFLELCAGMTLERMSDFGFSIQTGEGSVGGRFAMRRLAAGLAGSFAELSLGLGLQSFHYAHPAHPGASDAAEVLLARFAFGAYLGERGELSLYYDHRHDDLAAGLMPGAGGAGIPGHVGLAASYLITPRLGVTVDLAVGSAYVALAALRFRAGDER